MSFHLEKRRHPRIDDSADLCNEFRKVIVSEHNVKMAQREAADKCKSKKVKPRNYQYLMDTCPDSVDQIQTSHQDIDNSELNNCNM